MNKQAKTSSMILGIAFVWFTTHFGGGFASGAQIIMARRNGEQHYFKIARVLYQTLTFIDLFYRLFSHFWRK